MLPKKAWEALGKATGRDHTHLINSSEHTAIRFRDIVAQPRKIVTSPIWSGVESEEVCYNAGYTNVHELIPWRTITGRQQFYQDHKWMRDFGEHLCVYKPAVDFKTNPKTAGQIPQRNKEITLNFLTPHQNGYSQYLFGKPAVCLPCSAWTERVIPKSMPRKPECRQRLGRMCLMSNGTIA